VAVFVGSIIIKFWNVPIVDALLSVGFAVFILINVFKNFLVTVRIFLQAIPTNIKKTQL